MARLPEGVRRRAEAHVDRARPWYVVPADRKWYRNWAVAELLVETLTEMDPQFPEPSYDVAEQWAALQGVGVPG